MPKGPTQLERVIAVLPTPEDLENIRANHATLRDVLDDAQNCPPEGTADGFLWTRLRSIERRLSALLEATDEYVVDGGKLREPLVSNEVLAGVNAAVAAVKKLDAGESVASGSPEHAALIWAVLRLVEAQLAQGQRIVQRLGGAPLADTSELHNQVTEFHRAFHHPIRETPGPISEDRVRFRARLIAEEFFETLAAMFGKRSPLVLLEHLESSTLHFIEAAEVIVNLPEFVDGCADLDYVVEGSRIEFGVNGTPIAREVHRANMSKLGGGKREDGKSLKPAGWRGARH